MRSQHLRQGWVFRTVAFIQAAVFISSTFALPLKAYAQSVMELPAPGAMVSLSDAYVPVMLRAVKSHPDQPLVFDFIVDSGNTKASQEEVRKESEKLAKYFLASLTIPEKDLWVNLSPYEQDRVVPEMFGQTQMGRDLLAQDYILKQISASLIHPEKDLGKEFWDRVNTRVSQELGTSEIPANTFNKVWVIPEKAVVYEVKGTNAAVIGETHLKVMLEQDYLAMKNNMGDALAGLAQMPGDTGNEAGRISTDAIRAIILPEIEKEVNVGRNFAALRQVYSTLVLATWYKENLKESLLAQVYADQNKIAGVDVADKAQKEKIYEQYIAAYRQGVFNLIKEEVDPLTRETLPRKYFSGGNVLTTTSKIRETRKVAAAEVPREYARPTVPGRDFSQVTVAVADAAELNVMHYKAPLALPMESLTAQSLPNLAFDLAKGLDKTLRTKGKDKDIVEGVSYDRDGNKVTIYFTDGEPVTFDVNGKDVVITTERPDAQIEGDLLSNMLLNDARFSNTGYARPVTLVAIHEKLEKSKGRLGSNMEKMAAAAAWEALGLPADQLPAVVVVNTGAEEVFGAAFIDGRFVLEEALLERTRAAGNPYGMLTRAFIFAAAKGDWVGKKVLEFAWAKQNFQELASKEEFQNLDQLEQMFRKEVNHDLLNDTTLNPENRGKMMALLHDIAARIDRMIATMGVYLLNNELETGGSVFFALAADPFHWGQMDTLFRAMMTTKTLGGIFRLQGPDFRKILTLFTLEHRKRMMNALCDRPEMKRYFSMPDKMIGTVDGETQLNEFLIANIDTEVAASNVWQVNYLVGTDHMHFDAPSKTEFDANGLAMPAKLSEKENQPDTIRKLLLLLRPKIEKIREGLKEQEVLSREDLDRLRRVERVIARLDDKMIVVTPVFNERSPFDSIPVSGEQADVEESVRNGLIARVIGSNIPAASSTAIRNALAGIPGYEWSLAFLFKSTRQQIMENDVYRGWAIKLPDTIRNLANGKVSDNDVLLLQNWLALTKKRNPGLTAEDIGAMFTLPAETVQSIKKEDPNFKLKDEDAKLSTADVQAALKVLSDSGNPAAASEMKDADRAQDLGGIDLANVAAGLRVQRTGDTVTVSFDPAMIERIKTQGVNGFKPVIINIMPVRSLLPALGLAPAEVSGAAT